MKKYTGLGSKLELDFHIENAALRFHQYGDLAPKGLCLTGVRNRPLKKILKQKSVMREKPWVSYQQKI